MTYTAFGDAGETRILVRAPERVRIPSIDGTTVWTEQLEQDDVPTLSRFALMVTDGRDG